MLFFHLKAILNLEIFKVLYCFYVMQKNGLTRKIKLFSKFYDVTTWLQTITILTNISRTIRNQAIKFGDLIEHNTRNIFLGKSYTKYGGDTLPRPFSKKSQLSISLDQQSKVLCSLFLYAKLKTIKIHLNLVADPLLSPHKAFLKKTKRGLELVSLPHFLHDF